MLTHFALLNVWFFWLREHGLELELGHTDHARNRPVLDRTDVRGGQTRVANFDSRATELTVLVLAHARDDLALNAAWRTNQT